MSRKQHSLISILVLVIGLMGGMLLSQLFVVEHVFAQKEKQKEKVINISKLDQKINAIEQNIKELSQKVNIIKSKVSAIKQNISKDKVEILAAHKLCEISEKNLTTPTLLMTTLLGFFALIGGLAYVVIIVFRKAIFDEIEKRGKEYEEKYEILMTTTKGLTTEGYESFGHAYMTSAVLSWDRNNFDKAINFGERAIVYLEKIWGREPENSINKDVLYKYQSNLGYFYVEKKRTDKKQVAIKYAKNGLETGKETDDLQSIDNYLYIIMKFSKSPEDEKEWLGVFETYKNRIFEKIRAEEEQKEYEEYYNKTKK